MGTIALLAVYDIALTSLAGYGDYARFHAPVDPLLTVVILGTILAAAVLVVREVSGGRSRMRGDTRHWIEPHVRTPGRGGRR
jgi:hypothetical protein